MKSRQKIIRVLLETEARKDFQLFGIVSAEPDYRLSLSINKALKISLKNDKPLELQGRDGMGLTFSRFSYHSGKHDLTYTLISNKSGKDFFITKLKKIDYLFQVYSPDNDFNLPGISTTLRSVDTLTALFVLDPSEIKDKNIQYLIP
jgi:hypothetical protein